MSRANPAAMREHLRERNNMSNSHSNRAVGEDHEGCVINHSRLNDNYCKECGKKTGGEL